jgi:hypothetical protein
MGVLGAPAMGLSLVVIGAVWSSAPIGIHLLGQFGEVPQLVYTYWGSLTSAPIGIHLLGQFQEVPQLLYTYWGSFTNAPNSVDGNYKCKCSDTNSNKVKNNKFKQSQKHQIHN